MVKLHAENLVVDNQEQCASFDLVGLLSDCDFDKLEQAFNVGGLGIIPVEENLSGIWYDTRDFNFPEVMRLIEKTVDTDPERA